MQSKHANVGYSDIYRALVFIKEAQNTYMYPPYYQQPPQQQGGGFSRGLGAGLVGGGLAGVGSSLYDIYGERNQLMQDLDAAQKSRAKVRPPVPNLMQDVTGPLTGKKGKVNYTMHRDAPFLYGLSPEDMDRFKSKNLGEFATKSRKVVPPAAMREAMGRLEGWGGFGRYALSRGTEPLLRGLKWGVPLALGAAVLGGTLS